MIIIGLSLIVATMLCSSELFRRGVYSDEQEIKQRAEKNETGCGLLIVLVVCAILSMLFLAAGGVAVMGGGL